MRTSDFDSINRQSATSDVCIVYFVNCVLSVLQCVFLIQSDLRIVYFYHLFRRGALVGSLCVEE